MTFSRNDMVWWHDPSDLDRLHHGWVESIERTGLAVAEAGRPTQVVPVDYVHGEADQPPVPTCPLCMRDATSQAAD
jgi:hypothetical protein